MTTKNKGIQVLLTGKCYCGTRSFSATQEPLSVAYCHCDSCRRSSGAPVAAFVALNESDVTFTPDEGRVVSVKPGVNRTFCPECGSSLVSRYDYLPGQVYISLGVVDQANDLKPGIHCHESERIKWLKIDDNLERVDTSARSKLKAQ